MAGTYHKDVAGKIFVLFKPKYEYCYLLICANTLHFRFL